MKLNYPFLSFPIFSTFILSLFFQTACSNKTNPTSSESVQQQSSTTDPEVVPPPPEEPVILALAAKGQVLGSCRYQADANLHVTTAPSASEVIWPMVSCDAQGNVTCASGFSQMDDTPVQMNCSPNPSNQLVNCYWQTRRCVRTIGSTDLNQFVRGQLYGGCLRQANEKVEVIATHYVSWPMVKCDTSGYECAEGFSPVLETPVQMNCSPTPSKKNMLGCYWNTVRCMKL